LAGVELAREAEVEFLRGLKLASQHRSTTVSSVDFAGVHVTFEMCCPDAARSLLGHLSHIPRSGTAGLTAEVICAACAESLRLTIPWVWSDGQYSGEKLSSHVDPHINAVVIYERETLVTTIVLGGLAPDDFDRRDVARSILSIILEPLGLFQLHAATLGDQENCVLLANKSGSGKTSLTVAGVREGLSTVGDDFLAVNARDSLPFVYSLFSTARLHTSSYAWTGAVGQTLDVDMKYQFDLNNVRSSAVVVSQLVRAIVVPSIGDRTSLHECSWREVMQALMPSSIRVSKYPKDLIYVVERLFAGLPSFQLVVGSDVGMALQHVKKLAGVEESGT
jgi:hypothetical protein